MTTCDVNPPSPPIRQLSDVTLKGGGRALGGCGAERLDGGSKRAFLNDVASICFLNVNEKLSFYLPHNEIDNDKVHPDI